jgi:hypothetical protein
MHAMVYLDDKIMQSMQKGKPGGKIMLSMQGETGWKDHAQHAKERKPSEVRVGQTTLKVKETAMSNTGDLVTESLVR